VNGTYRNQQQYQYLFRDRTMKRLFLALLLSTPYLASAQQARCPPTLPEGSIQVVRPPAGWLSFSPSLTRLTNAGVMSGHPREMQYLVPRSGKSNKGSSVDIWEFNAGEEKWLWCEYGSATVQLAKRLDDMATRCMMSTIEEHRGVLFDVTVVCDAKQ